VRHTGPNPLLSSSIDLDDGIPIQDIGLPPSLQSGRWPCRGAGFDTGRTSDGDHRHHAVTPGRLVPHRRRHRQPHV